MPTTIVCHHAVNVRSTERAHGPHHSEPVHRGSDIRLCVSVNGVYMRAYHVCVRKRVYVGVWK